MPHSRQCITTSSCNIVRFRVLRCSELTAGITDGVISIEFSLLCLGSTGSGASGVAETWDAETVVDSLGCLAAFGSKAVLVAYVHHVKCHKALRRALAAEIELGVGWKEICGCHWHLGTLVTWGRNWLHG